MALSVWLLFTGDIKVVAIEAVDVIYINATASTTDNCWNQFGPIALSDWSPELVKVAGIYVITGF
jgi:hypothetical protein